MIWIFLLFPLFVGGLQAIQGVSNGIGSRTMGSLWFVVFMSLVQMAVPLVIALSRPHAVSIGETITNGWKYFLFSGVLGTIIVGILSFSITKIGATPSFAMVIVGQIIVSTLADRFGLFGVEPHPISAVRLTSVIVMTLGACLLFFEK
jgi:bacterial/archaeal transporter family-2 protein